MTARDRLLLAALALVAVYVVAFRAGVDGLGASLGLVPPSRPVARDDLMPGVLDDGRQPAFDVYAYYYPNMLYAAHAVGDGGRGLFWNPFQSCGQAFFGLSGVLYPSNVLFLVFNADLALRLALLFDLSIAGVFAFLLGRELGLGAAGAFAGAAAFQLGNATLALTTWGPFMSGPWVWLPAAMLFCERLLRRPSPSSVGGLAIVLALALLPDYPQTVFFIYQLVVLRVLWAVAGRAASLVSVGSVALGLLLAPLLAAVAFLPALEIARESVRNVTLRPEELSPVGSATWENLRTAVAIRSCLQPFTLVTCMLGAAALLDRHRRRIALFFLAAGAFYFVLGLGRTTPLYGWYTALPLGSLFRTPEKFYWLTSFCLGMAAAIGVEGVLAARAETRGRVVVGVLLGTGLALFWALGGFRLHPAEWTIGGLALAVVALAPGRGWAAAGLCAVLLLGFVVAPSRSWQYLLPDGRPVTSGSAFFARLRSRMTPQERVYVVPPNRESSGSFALTRKAGSLFGVPTILDYEPQVSRRYAEFSVFMRTGRPMAALTDTLFSWGSWMLPTFNRPMLDLAAGRWIVATEESDVVGEVIKPPPRLVERDGALRVYENPSALPRARFVPGVRVVASPTMLLFRLGKRDLDPRGAAFVEEAPPAGFVGVPYGDRGTADFLLDEPEHVTIRVAAPARGFLYLADQYFPGWQATVNGQPSPILRADHVFRLVEVPAGESVVEFRYAPASLRIGAALSLVGLFVVVVLLRRPERVAG